MAEVARLVGIEQRSYTDRDGNPRIFCGLHMMHLAGTVRGISGSKVESVSCPRELDPALLELNRVYQMEYETYDTRNGKAARLVDLLPVEDPEQPQEAKPLKDAKAPKEGKQ